MFKEYFEYDGVNLIWKKLNVKNQVKLGDTAGTIKRDKNKKTAYVRVMLNGKEYKAHNIIWNILNGEIPNGFSIDHIDGNGINNMIENLRLIKNEEQSKNKSIYKSNSSGVVGVVSRGDKFRAYINKDKKRIWLGTFDSKESAINARKIAEKECGYHENHGRKNCV
jgi:hypothetical protein